MHPIYRRFHYFGANEACCCSTNERRRKTLLKTFEMELSPEKSSSVRAPGSDSFEFLGIEFSNGFIRPSGKACQRLRKQIEDTLTPSAKALWRIDLAKHSESPCH